MKVPKIQDLREMKRLIGANKKILAFFYADWCPPSTRFLTTLEEFVEYYPEVKFLKINVDEKDGPKISDQAKVTTFPASVFIKHGKAVYAQIGADKEALQEKLTIFSKPIIIKEPENYILAENLDEYTKAKEESKIGVAIFYNNWSIWNNTNNYFFCKLARKYPFIKFLKVGTLKNNVGWAGTKENFNTRPALIFYYDGKKKFIVEDDDRKFIEDSVREFADTLPNSEGLKINSDEKEEVFKSIKHEHPLKLVLRHEVFCSVCGHDVTKNEKIFYCIQCQFNLCQICKGRELGLKVKDKDTIKRIKDVTELEALVKKEKNLAVYVYDELDEAMIEKISMFADHYNQLKFYRIRLDKATQNALRQYHLLQGKLYFIKNGSLKKDCTPLRMSNYCINDNVIRFLELDKKNAFKSRNDPHLLGKVDHLGFCCKVCRNVFPDNEFVPCYRCSQCMFDVCEYCKKFIK